MTMMCRSSFATMVPKRTHELHHYVPQFYLRHWCDEEEQFWVIPKNGGKTFRSGPRNVAAERGLYDTSRHTRLGQIDHEGIFAEFEGMVSTVWPGVFNGIGHPPTRFALASFISSLHHRHPKQKEWVSRIFKAIEAALANFVPGQSIEIVDGPATYRFRALEKVEGQPDTSVEEGFLGLIRSDTERAVAQVLVGRRWGVLHSPLPLLTCDNPVIVLKGTAPSYLDDPAMPGTEVLFPINPTMMLVINDRFEQDGLHYELTDIGNLNDQVRHAAKRFVFSSQKP